MSVVTPLFEEEEEDLTMGVGEGRRMEGEGGQRGNTTRKGGRAAWLVVEEQAEGGRGRRGFAAQQAVRAGLRWWAGVALATCTSARKVRRRGTSGRCHAAVAAGDGGCSDHRTQPKPSTSRPGRALFPTLISVTMASSYWQWPAPGDRSEHKRRCATASASKPSKLDWATASEIPCWACACGLSALAGLLLSEPSEYPGDKMDWRRPGVGQE